MKNTTKVGLVSSAVYAASSFALPAFANTVEQPVFQPVDVERITTVEQAENIYNTKLAEYAQDRKITVDEIKHLTEIKSRARSIVKGQLNSLEKEEQKLTEKAQELYNPLRAYEKKLANLDNQLQHPNAKKSLEENLNQLEKEVLAHYPGLIKKDKGLIYSAETELLQPYKDAFNRITKDTHNILEQNYGDNSLCIYWGRYTLRAVVAFHDLLKAKISTIKDDGSIDEKVLLQEKQELTAKIKSLEAERDSLLNSKHTKQLGANIKQLRGELARIEYSYKPLQDYLVAHDKIESFVEKHNDLSKYYSLSLIDLDHYYHDCKTGVHTSAIPYIRMRISLGDCKGLVSDVKSYFKGHGFEVSVVDKLRNPAKPKLPLWFIPMTIFAPMFRNMFVIKYLGGGKQTGKDYGCAFGWGAAETGLFLPFLDSVHPLVYPVRMVGFPFVWHGIMKLTGADKVLYDYAK